MQTRLWRKLKHQRSNTGTRGILPAASLFIFVWHQAFQRKLMYENNEFDNLTAHLKQMTEKKKERTRDKEEKQDTTPRPRKISDVAEFLIQQEKKKTSKRETRTNVFMTFLITLLTTWRRPLRWTIQVVVYALILWGTYFLSLYHHSFISHSNTLQQQVHSRRLARNGWKYSTWDGESYYVFYH
jgi:hypothetical protein